MNKLLCLASLCFFAFSFEGIAQDLTIGLSGTAPTCSDFTDGVVSADITGGTAPYTIMWNTGSDGLQVSGAGGEYSITVTDANGMTASNDFILQAPAPIEPVVTSSGDACMGGGTLQATVTGGTGAYTYAWPDGSTGTSVDGLGSGLHCVTVTDENGCAGVGCLQVSGGISVTLSVIDVTCFNGCDASIEATVSGGVAPYSYAWSNGAPDHPVNENLPFGTYSVTVTDGNGCTAMATINAGNGSQVDVSISALNPNCDSGALGSATATASGAAEPYTYAWSNGQSTATATGLSPGTYSVTATDANGCQGSESVTIEDVGSISVSVASSFNCGDVSGSATATVNGGSEPYTYTWSNGQSTATATDLLPNTNYSVTVMDGNGCSAIASALISGSDDITVDISSTDVACNGETTGSANATIIGGTEPYTYLWSSGQSSPSLANLAAGTYSLTVSDANGCGGSASVTIGQPDLLSVSVSTTDATCDDQNSGSASADVTGGTAPYTYEWNNGSTDPNLTDLGAGGYMVIVTDANGCTASGLGTLLAISDLTISTSSTDVSCGGAADGSATVMVSGGAGNYTYAWSNGETTATISGLNGGTYDVTVSENGCSGTGSVSVSEPTAVSVSATTSSASCDGGDASADATASGGTGPYTYAWDNGETAASISGLSDGSYTVTATDANGCTATTTVSVSTSGISVSVTGTSAPCAGDAAGSATASASGGTAPYTYTWNNGQTGATISNLVSAGYIVTVTDANGCTATGDVLLSLGAELELSISSTNITCNGMADGAATVSVTGGTSPYSYSWSNGSTNPNISNLGAGSYAVTVTDVNGCSATGSTNISESAGMTITLSPTPTCEGQSDGTITASVSGGSPAYNYQWSNGSTGASISDLGAGTYSLTVTDGQGCSQTATATVQASSAPTVSITIDQEILLIGGNEGALTAVATGEAPYTYAWSNGSTTATIEDLSAGTYTVTVTDASGCSAIASETLEAPVAAKIGNFAWNDYNRNGIQDINEQGIPGILVRLDGTDAMGNQVILAVTTDENGFYLFDNLNPGTYKLTFKAPTSYIITLQDQGGNDALDSDINSDRMTDFFTLSAGECNLDMDGGFHESCVNLSNPGSIAADQTLCLPNEIADPIVSVVDPSGGQGNLEIIWMRNAYDVPFSDPSWEIIPGANGLSYDPGSVASTTYFARCARRSGCSTYQETNLVKITVGPIALPVITADDEICVDQDFTFAGSPSGNGAVYTWNFGPGASPSTATGQFAAAQWSTTGNKTVELTVTRDGCSATGSKVVRVVDHVDVCGGHLVSDGTEAVSVYPNPAESNMMLRVADAFTTDVTVDIVNSRGRVIMTTTWPSGTDQLEINLDNHPAGMYFVRIQRENEAPALIRTIKQ